MKISNNRITTLCAIGLFAMFGIACSGSATDSSTAAPVTTSGTPTTADNSAKPAQAKNLAGVYNVTGTNVDGAGNYEGQLTITDRDKVLQFSWASGGKTYDGVGVQSGDTVAVAFTEGADGKGCGVVLYSIGANGDLDGKAGYWGVNESESEKAKRTSGTDLEGKYDVSGKNVTGGEYKGTLDVKKDGDGYAFEWKTPSVAKGFGIRQGDTASVGIGGQQCGFVSYEIKADGTLEGKWGGQTTKKFGTEVAKKK